MYGLTTCVLNIAVITLVAMPPASAEAITKPPTVFSFDGSADLGDNFFTDVIAGDARTEWRPGYSAQAPFPASDGGFVLFNQYDTGNSLAFKNGSNFLNSFEVSPQYGKGGSGVAEAIEAGLDYRLTLYNIDLEPVYSAVLITNSTGAWDKLTFDLPDIYAIGIAPRTSPTDFRGWWPNIDNVRVNWPVPEPSTLALAALGALGLLIAARRKR